MFRSGANLTDCKSQTDTPESTQVYSYQGGESDPAAAESESIAREITEGILSAFVGGATEITGEASFNSVLRVDGAFSGRISSVEGTLFVGAGGRVEANVAVAVAKIQGTLIGDIIATECVELDRTANVTGNIQAPALIVAPGAVLEGNCRMLPVEVLSEPAVVSEPETTPEPQATAVAAAVTEAEIASAEAATVSKPETAIEQKTAPEKPPKVERKENVLGKTRRSRTKAATTKATDEESSKAMAG